ncbi:hypothetical protein M5585_26620 [Serratia ureilytica]
MQALSANSGNNSAALFSLFMSSVPVSEEGSFSAKSIAPAPVNVKQQNTHHIVLY